MYVPSAAEHGPVVPVVVFGVGVTDDINAHLYCLSEGHAGNDQLLDDGRVNLIDLPPEEAPHARSRDPFLISEMRRGFDAAEVVAGSPGGEFFLHFPTTNTLSRQQ